VTPRQFDSVQAARSAEAVQKLFRGSFSKWDALGCVRRVRPPLPGEKIPHLVRPRPSRLEVGPWPHDVWRRVEQLVQEGRVAATSFTTVRDLHTADVSLVEIEAAGYVHQLCMSSRETWGVRMAQYTGPAGYWSMLLWRLRAAGTLTVHRGVVCAIDRSLGLTAPALSPIACPDERTFFRLARTRYREPHDRLDRGKDNVNDWARGLLPEWYPPGVKVYADPSTDPALFSNVKDVDPRFVGKDADRWLRT